MNVNEILEYCNFVANKHQSGGYFSPEEFNRMLPEAQMEFIRERIGLVKDYDKGRSIPRIAWEMTQKVKDDLRPLLVPPTNIAVDSNGQMIIPADYLYLTAIRYNYQEVECGEVVNYSTDVEIVETNEWGTRLNAAIKKPTKDYPIGRFENTFIQYAPKDLTQVEFSYLRKPVTPVRVVTLDADDNEIYDNTASVQLEIGSENHIEICHILLAKVGIRIKDGDLYAYAEKVKTQGI